MLSVTHDWLTCFSFSPSLSPFLSILHDEIKFVVHSSLLHPRRFHLYFSLHPLFLPSSLMHVMEKFFIMTPLSPLSLHLSLFLLFLYHHLLPPLTSLIPLSFLLYSLPSFTFSCSQVSVCTSRRKKNSSIGPSTKEKFESMNHLHSWDMIIIG